jgi:hypothetical protein
MKFDSQAYDLLESALKVLKYKVPYPHSTMLGYLMPNIDLETAIRIAKIIDEREDLSE